MLGKTLIDLFFNLLSGLFSGLEFVGLPLQAINALSSIICYGSWIVGIDILALFGASVVFWWGVHLSIGLAIWLWDKLPLV